MLTLSQIWQLAMESHALHVMSRLHASMSSGQVHAHIPSFTVIACAYCQMNIATCHGVTHTHLVLMPICPVVRYTHVHVCPHLQLSIGYCTCLLSDKHSNLHTCTAFPDSNISSGQVCTHMPSFTVKYRVDYCTCLYSDEHSNLPWCHTCTSYPDSTISSDQVHTCMPSFTV